MLDFMFPFYTLHSVEALFILICFDAEGNSSNGSERALLQCENKNQDEDGWNAPRIVKNSTFGILRHFVLASLFIHSNDKYSLYNIVVYRNWFRCPAGN